MIIKQYKHIKQEVDSKEFELPTIIQYYFQTGIRRSIRIAPIFTTWNKEQYNKEEEIYEYVITFVYNSFPTCKCERVKLQVSSIEERYHNPNENLYDFVRSWIDGFLDKRTKEQFDNDLNNVLNELK